MRHMLAIIIPYSSTPQSECVHQFLCLVKSIAKYLPYAYIYVIEQCNDQPFNPGGLLNAGVKVAGMSDTDVLCFLPADFILSESIIDIFFTPLTDNTVRHSTRVKRNGGESNGGGLLMMHQGTFKSVNGFPNDVGGWWCGEGDAFRDRLLLKHYNIEAITPPLRPALNPKANHPDAWEQKRRHKAHAHQNGYNEVCEQIHQTYMYSKRCFHYWVTC